MDAADTRVGHRTWWWGFGAFALVSLVHVAALATHWVEVVEPTKLGLMPALAIALLWGGRGTAWGIPLTILFTAIAFSWLGDGVAVFFPSAPELPTMLAWFALAHLCYIWLFWRHLALRKLPRWTLVYAVWWIVILVVLWPALGALAVAVAAYGIVLGGTAVAASRCHPAIAWGGAFFLLSDTVLAFRLFLPDAMPDWTSPLVMVTYCLGQGLISLGAVLWARAPERRR